MTARALQIGDEALPVPALKLWVEGTSSLVLQPEFGDVDRLRSVLGTIDDNEALLALLERILDNTGVTVLLGSEHEVGGVDFLGCVGRPTAGPPGPHAAITLVGPTRMDYEGIIPIVDITARLLSNALSS